MEKETNSLIESRGEICTDSDKSLVTKKVSLSLKVNVYTHMCDCCVHYELMKLFVSFRLMHVWESMVHYGISVKAISGHTLPIVRLTARPFSNRIK